MSGVTRSESGAGPDSAAPSCWLPSRWPAKGDEVIATIQAKVVPVLKTQNGFCGSVAGMDAHSGRGIMATIFDSRENLEASDIAIAGLREQLRAFAEMADTTVDTFELVLSELPTSVSVAQ